MSDTTTAAADTIQSLLSDIKKWTKSAYARDKFGNAVNANSPHASCWCLTGALYLKHETANYYIKDCRIDARKIFKAIQKLFPEKIKFPKDLQDKVRNDLDSYPGAIHGQIMLFNDLPETTFFDIRKIIEEAGV